jgi:hypothetical protein
MKLTTAIVAAILAFTTSAMPIVQQNSKTPETTPTGLPFDSHPDKLKSVPTISSDSDFPNNLKDFPIITRDEKQVEKEIRIYGCRPARIFGGHGPIIQPPHCRNGAQIERRDNSTDQPFKDVYEIYWEEHLNEILNTVCPAANYFKFGPRLSSVCSSWTPPWNISAVGGFNSTSNITTTNHLERRYTEAYPNKNDRLSHVAAQVKAASIFDKLEIVFYQPANSTAKHQALLNATEKLKALSDTAPEFAVLFGGRLRGSTLHSKYVRPSNTTPNSTATTSKPTSRDLLSTSDRVNSVVPKLFWSKVPSQL